MRDLEPKEKGTLGSLSRRKILDIAGVTRLVPARALCTRRGGLLEGHT
jgi:hypothetical protein